MNDGFFPGLMSGIMIALMALAVFMAAMDIDTPRTHYFENVCAYEGGEIQGDVCIKNGRVIEIKGQ